MSKSTFLAALLGLTLSAFCPDPPEARAAEMFGFNHADAAPAQVLFVARKKACRASRHRRCHDRRSYRSPVVDAHEGGYSPEFHPLLRVANRYLGRGKVTRLRGPWCRDFVNLVARQAGVRLRNNSRRAIDALGLGPHVANPQPGDLVVMRHHVTIFAGWGGRGVLGLGGNQGRRVKMSSYPRRKVLAFVRV